MLELAGFMGLFVIGGLVLSVLAIVGVLIKVFFKLLLIPLAVAGWFLKALLGLLAVAVTLVVVGPVVLVVGLVVLLPLLLVAGLIWGTVTVLSAA